MKKSFNIVLAIILTAVAGLTSIAQEEPSDAVYEQVIKEYTLQADGSWSYHFGQKLRLLTYYSFHTLYGEDFIVYDPEFQTLKINKSNTVMANGKLVKGPDNAFNEVLPGFAANAASFNRLREMVVTHTGLERGALIDFDYTLTTRKGFSAFFTGNESLLLNSPVKEMKLIIHVPKTMTFNYHAFNTGKDPLVLKTAAGTTYTWTLVNLPAATREDFRLRDLSNRPRVIFSSAKNMEALIRSFVSQPAFSLTAGAPLSDKVKSVTGNETDDIRKMLALQDFTVNELNYNPVPAGTNGFRVRTADEVFGSNGGTEIEKALLLATVLKAAGFQAEPVAIFPESLYRSNSANFYLAEKYLVKVTSRSMNLQDPVFLSPLQNDSYDQSLLLAGKKAISLLPSEAGKNVKLPDAEHSLELSGTFELVTDKLLKGKIHGTFEGRFNPWFKLYQDSSACKRLLSGLSEAREVKDGRIEDLSRERARVDFTIESKDRVREQSEHYFLTLPALSSGIDGWHMTELVTSRKEALEIPFLLKESYRFSITLPDGFELITPEIREKVSRNFGAFEVDIFQDGKTLQVDRKISLKKGIISPSEYSDFRAFINTWNSARFKEFIVRKGPK